MAYEEAKSTLSLAEKVGQFFMPAAFINDSEEAIKSMESLIQNNHIGGICFFHSKASAATNFEGKKNIVYNAKSYDVLKNLITRYQAAARYPLLISIDAEWGLAMRVEETPQYPYAITLGATQDMDLVYEVGKKIGEDCRAAGIHWNFAPVADINNNPDNPVIGYRSFGSDPDKVASNAIAFSKGLQDAGVLSCVKHFPGHGDTATDSHLGLPLIAKTKETLLKCELKPFKALIRNKVDGVMVGHLSIPALTGGKKISASLSREIIKGILRESLGFEGVVVSDALNMHSVSKTFTEKGILEWTAFDSGTDILCFAEHVAEGIEAILEKATKEQIEASFKRVWRLKEKALKQKGQAPAKLSNPLPLNSKVSLKSLTLMKGTETALRKLREGKFFGIGFGNNTEDPFLHLVKKATGCNYGIAAIQGTKALEAQAASFDHILISIRPPKIKPQNTFDMPQEEMAFLLHLINTHRTTVYLFGNPYFIRLLPTDKIESIIIAYQQLDGFAENAAHHFMGKMVAQGVLPVSL